MHKPVGKTEGKGLFPPIQRLPSLRPMPLKASSTSKTRGMPLSKACLVLSFLLKAEWRKGGRFLSFHVDWKTLGVFGALPSRLVIETCVLRGQCPFSLSFAKTPSFGTSCRERPLGQTPQSVRRPWGTPLGPTPRRRDFLKHGMSSHCSAWKWPGLFLG